MKIFASIILIGTIGLAGCKDRGPGSNVAMAEESDSNSCASNPQQRSEAEATLKILQQTAQANSVFSQSSLAVGDVNGLNSICPRDWVKFALTGNGDTAAIAPATCGIIVRTSESTLKVLASGAVMFFQTGGRATVTMVDENGVHSVPMCATLL